MFIKNGSITLKLCYIKQNILFFHVDVYNRNRFKGFIVSQLDKHHGEGTHRMQMLTQGLREGKEAEEEKHRDITRSRRQGVSPF